MKKTKRVMILALVCANLVLLAALVHVNVQPARAALYKTTDYVVVTGKLSSSLDALYVIDLATQKMAAFTWDKTNKRMKGIGKRRELTEDFKIGAPRGGGR